MNTPAAKHPVLYYAPGGGLGHVRRAQKVAHALGFADNWVLVTSSPYACVPWHDRHTHVDIIPSALAGNPEALREWIMECIERIVPAAFYVDAFPGGLFGECCGLVIPADIELAHVARLLDWKRYRQRVTAVMPRFAKVWMLENLHSAHFEALQALATVFQRLDLARVTTSVALPPEEEPPLWLVVHSEPREEVLDLVRYAQGCAGAEKVSPRIVVLSACAGSVPGTEWLAGAEATDWYPRASRLFTAAGFNTLLETEPWRARRHIIPMPRALDDQFERARRARQV